MRIGYVGLGNMGSALALRLQVSHELLVLDANPQAMRRAAEHGSTPARSLTEVGEACDIIFLCLPTSDHVRSVLMGEGGLAKSVAAGTIVVDQTTGDPRATRTMAAELLERGVYLVDAPVSGGKKGAEAGTIAIMVGAAQEQYERIHPVLLTISPNVFHAGGVGNGHVIKLVNNLMSGVQRLLTLEGMTLAAKNGVDATTAHAILMASGGRNAYIEKILGPNVLNGQLAAGFTLGLAHKDVRLACQLGIDSGVPLFLGNIAREMYRTCMNEMGDDAQVDTAALVMDRVANTHVVPEGFTVE